MIQLREACQNLAGEKINDFYHYIQCGRGLYSSFDREKPPYKKLPFLANFIKKSAPFIKKNSILAIFTDPKAKRSENAPNNQMQNHIKDLCCNFFIVPQLLK